jgi:hypothetical protein
MAVMTLSPAQAAENLKDIAQMERRSAQALGYSRFSPYLFLWGAIWAAGYLGSAALAPKISGLLWLGLDLAGLAGSAVIGYRQHKGQPFDSEGRRIGRRLFASFFIIVLFVLATFAVMWPVYPLRQAAFWALVVGLFYAIMGLWRGTRLLVTGLALMALTLGGFFLLREYFLYWMAATGGGALILAGFWFRQV